MIVPQISGIVSFVEDVELYFFGVFLCRKIQAFAGEASLEAGLLAK